MRELPRGTVTFLFTDIEGSTRLLQELGDGYADALAEHRRALREAFKGHDGVEVDTQGDAFLVAFGEAAEAVAAAAEGQAALEGGPIRVRMGLHTGVPQRSDEGYVGLDLHLGARVAAAGHGGQVLLSEATRELVVGDVRDLGEHRLKDFDEPVWIFQLGFEEFPPLKTISNTNLPRPASTFVGREREKAEIAAELQRGARLLTLTGPGGSGKTRLALEAAAELVPEFKSGVFWVGLAPLRDSQLVGQAIADVLGAKSGLAEHIGERELLLVVDNLEQVIESAPELAWLVEACPNLRLLVTSRERMRVRGEVEYPVVPLDELDAVELFCARARLDRDETIAELCGHLDNLPLAVELAAARAAVLSPTQILERLSRRLDVLRGGRDADPRQQTLRATIEWSYDLLDRDEQRSFARLAVFDGGCTIEAAEEVSETELDTLQSLVDKSLLRWTNKRFWMLETIREYARERLIERAEIELMRRRHAERVLRLARDAGGSFWQTDNPELLSQMRIEEDNIRAALGWAVEAEPALAASLAANLTRYWFVRGAYREGALWCDAALSRIDVASPHDRARVLVGASEFARFQHDYPRAIDLKTDAINLFRELGDDELLAATIKDLGEIAMMQGDWEGAEALIDESLAIRRRLGGSAGIAHSLHGRGELELARGNWSDSASALKEAAELFSTRGDVWNVALAKHSLAELDRRAGRLGDAATGFLEAIEMGARFDSPQLIAEAVEGIAALVEARAMPGQAALLAGAADAMRERAGAMVAYPQEHEKLVLALRGTLTEQKLAASWAAGRELSDEAAIEQARHATVLFQTVSADVD